jgi:hypothetical protein
MFGIDTVQKMNTVLKSMRKPGCILITLEQALYFDQHTYLRSLLHRNDRTTMPQLNAENLS